jgi:site-specific DNA-methyltransferase (adenine-specific)
LVSKKSGRRFIGFESNQDKLLLSMKRINEGE